MAGKKIAAKTTIKEVTGKAKGVQVKFGTFDLSSGQAERLMDLAKDKVTGEVLVTIEQVQKNLPGMDNK